MPQIIIHPGAPKTATTFLQNEAFNRHPEILNVGRPNHGGSDHAAMFNALMHAEDADAVRTSVRRYFEPALAEAEAKSLKAVVYSNESLSDTSLNSAIAERLHSVLPQAHILLTIRNQLKLAPSMYTGDRAILKNAPAPFAGRPVRFEAWFEHALANADMPDAKAMDFYRSYRAYADHFGTENVHVMLFEHFTRDRPGFLAELGEILGVEDMSTTGAATAPKANPSPSARLRAYQAFRSWFLPGRSVIGLAPGAATIRAAFDRFLKRGQSQQVELTPTQSVRIARLYGEGNRKLAEACKLDFAAEGYPIA